MTRRRAQGDPRALAALDAWSAGSLAAETLRESTRRRLLRLEPRDGPPLLLKQFRLRGHPHALRERLKRLVGRSPARREWRALQALHQAGAPVPRPCALASLPGGDPVVAMEFVPGRSFDAALAGAEAPRRALFQALGRAVAAFHAAGLAHGDLHAGNLLVRDGRIVILDVQRARPLRDADDALEDLGWLDYSLWRRASLAERVRVRAAALGLARPFDREARAALREVGREAELRARDHARSRTGRMLVPGRRAARVRWGDWSGLRVRELSEEDLRAALDAHRAALGKRGAAVLKDDGRSRLSAGRAGGREVVVKESPARGAARALADVLRGSAGRRAWRGGHGLLARGIGTARPLAFLERRVAGVPLASLVVLEDLRPAQPADVCHSMPAEAVVEACARLATALHRRAVDHGDLKASHVYLSPGEAPRLLDLDAVRFRRTLSARRRIQGLAELNASLPDRFPAAARRRAFERYAAALPFAGGEAGRAEALRGVVRQSLARHHRWSGSDCACAQPSGGVEKGDGPLS